MSKVFFEPSLQNSSYYSWCATRDDWAFVGPIISNCFTENGCDDDDSWIVGVGLISRRLKNDFAYVFTSRTSGFVIMKLLTGIKSQRSILELLKMQNKITITRLHTENVFIYLCVWLCECNFILLNKKYSTFGWDFRL